MAGVLERFGDFLKPEARLVGELADGKPVVVEFSRLTSSVVFTLWVGTRRWHGMVVPNPPVDVPWEQWTSCDLWLLDIQQGQMVRHELELRGDVLAFVSDAQEIHWSTDQDRWLWRFQSPDSWQADLLRELDHHLRRGRVDVVSVDVGEGLSSLVDALAACIPPARGRLDQDVGIALPWVHFRYSRLLERYAYTINLHDVEVASGTLPQDDVENAASRFTSAFEDALPAEAWRLLGRQEVQGLLERIPRTVVDEVIPGQMTLGMLQQVLQELVRRGLPIRRLTDILGFLHEAVGVTEVRALSDFVAARLGRESVRFWADRTGVLNVVCLDATLELLLRGDKATPAAIASMLKQLKGTLTLFTQRQVGPILLTAPNLNPKIRRLTGASFPELRVISWTVIPARLTVNPIAIIAGEP
ncbi:MAG TPA: FHIPEP family type III secretion protein [Candidatus Xenobia bacterium]